MLFVRSFLASPLWRKRPHGAGSLTLPCMVTLMTLLLVWAAPVMAKPANSAPAALNSATTETAPTVTPAESLAGTGKNTVANAGSAHSQDAPNSWTNSPSLLPPPGGLTLTPFLSYLPETSGKISAEQALKITSNPKSGTADTASFRKRTQAEHLLQREPYSVWAHFSMVQVPGFSRTSADTTELTRLAMLDLGDQIPGAASVWVRPTSGTLREVKPDENDLYALADMAQGGDVLIHMEGQPGLWFAPALRSLPEALGAPERRMHQLALAGLAMLFLLCLTRSVTERGDGRIWAAIFAGAALLHALLDLPATALNVAGMTFPHIRYLDMPGILAVGVALMLLPHVGRNIMRTRETSPVTDTVLLAMAIPGAALGLLPFFPNITWAIRLLPLWPLGAILPLIPALALLRRGVAGSGIFSLACLSMTIGTGLALWGAADGHTSLWAQGPLIGVIAAVLLLAAAPRSAYGDRIEPASGQKDTDNDGQHDGQHDEPLELDLDDVSDSGTFVSALRLEESLRAPLDALLREACALDQVLGNQTIIMPSPSHAAGGAPKRPFGNMPTPSSHPINEQDARLARRYADNLVAASRELSALVTNIPRTAARGGRPAPARRIFFLDKLVAEVVASVRQEADTKGVGLSWYIAPYLGQTFRADSERLRFTLRMLLADAVRATAQGVVSLRVRRGPNSLNPGHLLFSVSDTGEGLPPMSRSSLMLARAWELAADHGGELTVNGSPFGVEISFSLDCDALIADGRDYSSAPCPPTLAQIPLTPGTPNPNLVILASCVPLNRHLLTWHLAGQGQEVWEARDAAEAVAFYTHTPAALMIMDGNLPEDDIVTAIASIRVLEGEFVLSNVPFLALTQDEQQAERLRQAGCDDALLLPVSRDALRAMALQWAAPGSVRPRPDFSPRRVNLNRPKKHVLQTHVAQTRVLPNPSDAVESIELGSMLEFEPAAPVTPDLPIVKAMPAELTVAMPIETAVEAMPVAELIEAVATAESITSVEPPANAAEPATELIENVVAAELVVAIEPVPPIVPVTNVPIIDTEPLSNDTPIAHEPITDAEPLEPAAQDAPNRAPTLSLRIVKTPEPLVTGMTLGLPADKKSGMTLDMSGATTPSTFGSRASNKKPGMTLTITPHPVTSIPHVSEPQISEPQPAVPDRQTSQYQPNPPAVEPSNLPATDSAPSPAGPAALTGSTILVPGMHADIPPIAPSPADLEPLESEPFAPITSEHIVNEPAFMATHEPVIAETLSVEPIKLTAVTSAAMPAIPISVPVAEDVASPNAAHAPSPTPELNKPEPLKNVVPPKKRSWLSLFKPTPHIEEKSANSPEASTRSRTEWVGNPVPVGGTQFVPVATPVSVGTPFSVVAPPQPTTNAPYDSTGTISGDSLATPTSCLPSFLPEQAEQQDEHTHFLVVESGQNWRELGLEPLTDVPAPSFMPETSPKAAPETTPVTHDEPDSVPEPIPLAKPAALAPVPDSFHTVAGHDLAPVPQYSPLIPLESKSGEAEYPSEQPEQALLFDARTPKPDADKAEPATGPALDSFAKPHASNANDKAKRQRHPKGSLQDLPFLSLDPNYREMRHSSTVPDVVAPLKRVNMADIANSSDMINEAYHAKHVDNFDDIVELTEADMIDTSPSASLITLPDTELDTPLEQLLPAMLAQLDAALAHAEKAMLVHDARSLAQSAANMEEQALAFGLHGLSDLALCLKDAAQQHDFESASQLLPDLRAEVALQRHEENDEGAGKLEDSRTRELEN